MVWYEYSSCHQIWKVLNHKQYKTIFSMRLIVFTQNDFPEISQSRGVRQCLNTDEFR